MTPTAPRRCNVLFLFLLVGLLLAPATRADAATFVVSNVNNGGEGSLRQAILDSNSTPEQDRIIFQIDGAGVKTIQLSTALPPLTDPVAIDATSQTGYAGKPLVEVHGGNLVSNPGLRIVCGGCTIRGLAVIRFVGQGIELSGPGGNIISGNHIGVDADGITARPNGAQGIWINSSSGNLIGGTNQADRNVISGNVDAGIYIMGGSSNIVQGNVIGTTAHGTSALGNGGNGIVVNNSPGNKLGGTLAGAGNVISGNSASGIFIKDAGSIWNVVEGNVIGLAPGNTLPLGNGSDGVTINNAGANCIGGQATGAGNLISGNSRSGIYIVGSGQSNRIEGNFIGVGAAGLVGAGNTHAGVTIARATNNIIGGPGPARNVISGNKTDGVFLTTNAVGTLVMGNYIGLDATGTAAISNGYSGLTISSGWNNRIGPANVISGNSFDGVSLIDGAEGNEVTSNHIGTDAMGALAVPNLRAGFAVFKSPANIASGNVISGNGDAGIAINGSGANGNTVRGNKIGTDATGMTALPNYREGIYLRQCASNVIGGTAAFEGNLISGNGTWGISLTNAESTLVQGNVIGTAANRLSPLGNATRLTTQNSRFHTIELTGNSSRNVIGGAEPGSGNLIAHTPAGGGVLYAGVRIRDGATNNAVLGNEFVANAGLAVDLGEYLRTMNDPCDLDRGANELQNFPVLTRAFAGNQVGITGALNARANESYRLEFFATPGDAPDNDAVLFLGATNISSEVDCSVTFKVLLPVALTAGFKVSATAIDRFNNTSEFSTPVPAQALPPITWSIAPGGELVQLSWPAGYEGLTVKQTDSLNVPVTWTSLTNTTSVQDGKVLVRLPLTGPQSFFTLAFE